MSGFHTHALYHHGRSRLHELPAHIKVAGLVVFVGAVVATPRQAFLSFAVDALLLVVAMAMARLPVRFVLARLVVEIPFVFFALLLPFVGTGERIGVMGLMLSQEGLWGAWNILAKATLGVGASVVMAATTEIPDILEGLDRLRVPALITAIAGFMVRYLDVIAGEYRRMRVAMAARGYDPKWLGHAGPLATSAGALFIRSYERGERVHHAMLARGYDGTMPVIEHEKARLGQWLVGLAIPAAACLAAIGGIL